MQGGIRQIDMARALGKPQTFVSYYESGARRLDLLELRQIFKILGVSLVEFARKFENRAVRVRSGLSQAQFAGRYALNPRTVQDWEQGRTEPDVAVRAYLTVIDRNPRAVPRALAGVTERR